MKILFVRQLVLALFIFQTSLYGQNAFGQEHNPTVPIKQPKLYHPNDQVHDSIYTRLSPVHPNSLYHSGDNQMQDSIVDNDGNMYVTSWDIGKKKDTDFIEAQKICDQKIYERMILERAYDLSEIREEDIKPSLFKEHGNCIMSYGFTLKDKNGFSPDRFQINIFRSHLKSSTYMPVGAAMYVSKKSAKYIDTHKTLIQCLVQAKKMDNNGIVEEYSEVYTYVSIKPYVEFIESCMKDSGYSIEEVEKNL